MASRLAAFAQRGRSSPVPTALANSSGQAPVEINAEQFKATVPKTRVGNRGGQSSLYAIMKPQEFPTAEAYNEHNDVYDTDLESATDTTADINPHRAAANDNARQVLHDDHLHSENGETNETSEEEDDNDEDQLSELEYIDFLRDGKVSRVFKNTDPIYYAECLVARRNQAQYLALGDADSYPDTTSGAISILSETDHDYQRPNTDHHAVKPNTHPFRQHLPQSNQDYQIADPQSHDQNARAGHKVPEQARYHVADPPVVDDEALQHPPPGPGSALMQPLNLDRRRTEIIRHQNESHMPMTRKNEATHGGPTRHESSKRQYKATSSKIVEPSGASTPTKPTRHKDMRRTQDEQQPVQADCAPSSILHNKYASAERQDSEVELDHDLDALLKKKFSELQGEDYDVDPRNTPADSSQRLTEDMLRERMVGLVKAEPEQQRQFLASLSLYEWEDAGDWITNEFSLLLGKIKEKRREKRKLSREFEAEIERRHSEVARKRQITDEALVAMKGAGAHVLETPRKMKYQT